MKNLIMLIAGITIAIVTMAQAPQGFNYQAVIRNAEGQAIANQMVGLRISIQNAEGTPFYTETHNPTTSPLGVVSVILGNGSGNASEFESIPWEQGNLFLKLEVDPSGGSNYTPLGTSMLQAVPYALYAQKASEFVSPGTGSDDDPIFVVRNNLGQIVFAVYQTGVRVFVEDTGSKSSRGGFAVGGLSGQNKQEVEYLRVTPDSVRVNVNNPTSTSKSSRGGFAVGGLSGQNKALPSDLLYIAPEMARIYVDAESSKGSRGGFAVGGLSGQNKEASSSFLYLTPENYFIGHESGQFITEQGVYNSTLGYRAGMSLTTGRSNILIGFEAGMNTTIGRWNTVLGFKAGRENASGDFNTFLGYYAGWKNTSGGSNVFIGNESGQANEVGSNNVFLGYHSGYSSLASFNTFLGYQSGKHNLFGTNNAFMGYNAGYANINGTNNVYIGNEAGLSMESGFSNVFIGDGAGSRGTTGAWNVFVGYQSGYYTSDDGTHNVFLGHHSGFSNTSGWSNNFIGQGAGYSNSTGTNNIFIGNDAGRLSSVSSGNIYIGRNAGYNSSEWGNMIIGHTAGQYLSEGTTNVFLGTYAGFQKTKGSSNVFVGTSAGYYAGEGNNSTYVGTGAGFSATGSGNVFLGYNAGSAETGDNKLYISNSSTSAPLIYGDFNFGSKMVVISGNSTTNTNGRMFFVNGSAGGTTAWFTDSDMRLKHNILPITNALSKVLSLRGVTYEWNDADSHGDGANIGFIAQEVKSVLPEVVAGSEETSYSMQYAPITALLVEAIKEQQKIIERQQVEIEMLKSNSKELKSLKAELEAIKILINK
jgi:hypothetical protein